MSYPIIFDLTLIAVMTILGFLIGLFLGLYFAAKRAIDYSPKWAKLENLQEVKAVRDFLHDYRIASNDELHEKEDEKA